MGGELSGASWALPIHTIIGMFMEIQTFLDRSSLYFDLGCPPDWVEGETGIIEVNLATIATAQQKDLWLFATPKELYKKRKGVIVCIDLGKNSRQLHFNGDFPYGKDVFLLSFSYGKTLGKVDGIIYSIMYETKKYYACLLRKALNALMVDGCSTTREIKDFIFPSLILQYLESLSRSMATKLAFKQDNAMGNFKLQALNARILLGHLSKLCDDCDECKEIQ